MAGPRAWVTLRDARRTRDDEIVWLAADEGVPLVEIAAWAHLTPERVRQIVAGAGALAQARAARRAAATAAADAADAADATDATAADATAAERAWQTERFLAYVNGTARDAGGSVDGDGR